MDAKLLGPLAHAEEDFLSAMLAGDRELAAYDSAWTSLLDEITQASVSGDVNGATLAVADDVVARVSTLVDCCLKLSSASPPPDPFLDLNSPSPSAPPTTAFISEAYSWFLENIANPYPSSELKASLAQRYNSRVSAVSSWFANARRRVGWTALCRDFFQNCRADAVNAAYRVLVKEDQDHQLGPEIVHAFVTLKVTAEGLYAGSTQSLLASDLDAIVKDMSAKDVLLPSDGGRVETGGVECLKDREPEYTRTQPTHTLSASHKNLVPVSHPPSDSSCSSSPVSIFDHPIMEESESEEDIPPSSSANRQRCLSPPEPQAANTSWKEVSKFMKRPCLPLASSNDSLPSASTSTHNPLNGESRHQLQSVAGPQGSTNINSRKRRLSDPDAAGVLKRPRVSMAGAHLHPVSDPLPLSDPESEYSIDEWFRTNFDDLFSLPPPVNVAEPDILAQWEVELFNNYTLPENSQTTLIPPIQDNQLLPSPDLATLDELFQSLERDAFAAPLETTQSPIVTSVPDSVVPQGLSDLPDLSQPIDWTALLNEDPFKFGNDSMFPQPYTNSALPEMDLSMIQLPQVWTPVTS